MIVFGGIIFWTIIIVALLAECAFLYNENGTIPILITIALFVGLFFGLDARPSIDFSWYILLYPVLALTWLPIYWYLYLRRVANKIRTFLMENPRPFDYSTLPPKLRKHYISEWVPKPPRKSLEPFSEVSEPTEPQNNGKFQIRHPDIDVLTANAILFPISIPVFGLESIIEEFVLRIRLVMNKIRDNLSAKLNELINNE